MNSDFSKNLVLLRKEQGFSQKKVSAELNISQALLSHYEKGIRECGLEFVLRAADYFGVSCDYLLGRSSQRTLTKPEKILSSGRRSAEEESIRASVSIVFAILKKINSKSLTREITNYFCSAVYTMFRTVTDSKSLCKLSGGFYSSAAHAKLALSEARCHAIVEKESLKKLRPILSPEILERDYQGLAPSAMDMIRTAEEGYEAE